MIFDRQGNLDRYRGISGGLDGVIDFLYTDGLVQLPLGQTKLDGDRVFVNHFGYTTAPQSAGSVFEAHEKYLDLHLITSGREIMVMAPVERLRQVEVRADEDSVMYQGDGTCHIPLEQGEFILVWPGEGHLPRITRGEAVQVDKFVFKIAL